MIPMKAGSYVFHPANGHHFDGAKTDEVTVQIIGMGPVTSTRVTPRLGRRSVNRLIHVILKPET